MIKKHKGCLLETLKVYMEENKNIQKSIERLFIHRSTFNYRLEKIFSMFPEKMINTPEKFLYTSMVLQLTDGLNGNND